MGVSLAHQQQMFSRWRVRGPLTKNEQLTALGPDVGIPHWALSYPISLDIFFSQPGMPKLSPPSGSWHRPPQGGHNAPHPRSVAPRGPRTPRCSVCWNGRGWDGRSSAIHRKLAVSTVATHSSPKRKFMDIRGVLPHIKIYYFSLEPKTQTCFLCYILKSLLTIYIYFTNLQLSEIRLFGEEFPRLELGWEISH